MPKVSCSLNRVNLLSLWCAFLFEVIVVVAVTCYFLVTQTKPGVYFWFCICFCLNNVSSVSSSLRVLVPVQRAMQLRRTTEHSLLHPPPPICPPAVPTAKDDWAAAPSGLWTGQFVSFLLLIYRPLTGLN